MIDTAQHAYWEGENRITRSPTHPVVKAFVEPKLRFIERNVNLSQVSRLLDVGCGNGTFQFYLANWANAVGVDYSRHMLAMNPCPKLVQANSYALPFDRDSFDLVFESNLLHHAENPVQVLSEMKRVSRQFVVLHEPNRDNPAQFLFSLVAEWEKGGLWSSISRLKWLASQVELQVVATTTIGLVFQNKTPTFLLPVLQRLEFLGRCPVVGGYILLVCQV